MTIFVSNLPSKIKISATEIKGPKLGVPEKIIENFAKSKQINTNDLFKKKLDKGTFYFAKIKGKEIYTEEELAKSIPKILNELYWKKSMKWSDHDLNWGRPLRSILGVFDNKILKFKFAHLESVNFTIIEQYGEMIQKKIHNLEEYFKILKNNEIILDQNERSSFISKKIYSICKRKSCKEFVNEVLLSEVTNLVDKPNVIVASFDKII